MTDSHYNSSSGSEPKYRISVIAKMLDIHPQTIRTYEKLGLITPARSKGNTRLFSDRDVRTVKKIQTLTRDLGVNLAGVEIILRMSGQIEMMNKEARDVIHCVSALLEKHAVIPGSEFAGIIDKCQWLRLDMNDISGD